eukprot:TRINITY_DN16383_c0_g1_i1.p1 TRINITY_DN16383_c0_g1~~TRINITY_DN16383_c0_g1_i1.p1  ORF type:complete len:254 (+),score=89.49 TRINITY_DN16383_c0_g1_i1:104-763(+)
MNGVRACLQGPVFAVVHVCNHQHKVAKGDRVQLGESIFADIGEQIRLRKVLMVGGERFTAIGRPLLEGATVHATVEEHTRSKMQYTLRRYQNPGEFFSHVHRDINIPMTIIRIDDIVYEPTVRLDPASAEGSDATWQLSREATDEQLAQEEKLQPKRWAAEVPNGPEPRPQPPLAEDVVDMIRWRKSEQIMQRRLYTPGMRYWWWPKDRFDSGVLHTHR